MPQARCRAPPPPLQTPPVKIIAFLTEKTSFWVLTYRFFWCGVGGFRVCRLQTLSQISFQILKRFNYKCHYAVVWENNLAHHSTHTHKNKQSHLDKSHIFICFFREKRNFFLLSSRQTKVENSSYNHEKYTLVLIRTPKLSSVKSGQCLDGVPHRNTGYCKRPLRICFSFK